MEINIKTPYNAGDVIYIFSTENVMKYREFLISEQVTFKDICKYLCDRNRVDCIWTHSYIEKGVIKTKISMRLYRLFRNLHNERELYIAELSPTETPHLRSEIKEYNEIELLKRCDGVDNYDIIKVEDSFFSPLDKSILNSNSIIKYLKDKYSSTYSQLKLDIKSTEQIKKHLKKYGFKYPDILDALVSVLVNNITIRDADRMYKRDAIYSWKNYGHLTGPDLRHYNIHIVKTTQHITSSIIPLISLGIIGEITVDEFKDILGIN
jgi:hypothetical protein